LWDRILEVFEPYKEDFTVDQPFGDSFAIALGRQYFFIQLISPPNTLEDNGRLYLVAIKYPMTV
jgi:hypothetical protein